MKKHLELSNQPIVIVDEELVQKATDGSRKSERKRIILPLHSRMDDPLQRMLNALQVGSYIQPHRHFTAQKAESLILLRGKLGYVVFDLSGNVSQTIVLSMESGVRGIDIEPSVFHTFFALTEDTVVFEVKPGPYVEATDKDFASWAPSEGDEDSHAYLDELYDLFDE